MTAIVDCNSFYCSCERLFRPDLLNKPVVVLSNNDGCIISRTDEAKQAGIGMAGPYFQARGLLEKNGVAVFSSNYHLYGDMSWRVMETLRMLMGGGKTGRDKVEVYSVDEAFLDLDGIVPGEAESFARHIRETVEQWTGISVSVGVAPTRTLAKIANHAAKKNKQSTGCVQVLLSDDSRRMALQQTRVDGIWGVGRSYAERLINWGITSAWELSNMPPEWARKNLGGVVGVRLIRELRGEPSIAIEEELTDKKMIATTRMFGRPVTDLCDLQEAVATYTSRAAEKLRRQQSAARIVSVFIVPRDMDHREDFSHGASIHNRTILETATSLTHQLIKPAICLVGQMFQEGTTYKKAGVMLSGLEPDQSIQGNLFGQASAHSDRFLMAAIDNVNFGIREDTVKFASSGMKRNWKMRQELRSPRASTRWHEMRTVS